MISVVIPAFNAESTVSALIEDCMAQSYGNVEVVCVDDGSDDSTFATMEDMSRRYANVRALSIEHGGPTAARAAGVEAACGEWVIFADADDRVDPSWIEALVTGMARTDPQGKADIVAGASCWNRKLVDPDRSDAELKSRWKAAGGLFSKGPRMDEIWERLLKLPGNDLSISHSMCDKLFCTSLARSVLSGIDRSVRIGEDTCFNLVAFAQAQSVALTYATGYRWSKTEQSLSHYPPACALQDNKTVYAHVKRALLECDCGETAVKLWHDWMSHLVNNQVRVLVRGGDASEKLADSFMASYEEEACSSAAPV